MDVSPFVLLTRQSKVASVTSYAVSQMFVNSVRKVSVLPSLPTVNPFDYSPSIMYGAVVESAVLSMNVMSRLPDSIKEPSVGQPDTGTGSVVGA